VQQLVIKDGLVIAAHGMYQDIRGKYLGAEIISYDGGLTTDSTGSLGLDPRTGQEKKEAYKDKRRLEYPGIVEQLDMIYHDTMDGTTTWVDAVTDVKARHPKPVAEDEQ
jgi:hypothetical protein